MKKVSGVLALVLASLVFSGCSGDLNPQVEKDRQAVVETEEATASEEGSETQQFVEPTTEGSTQVVVMGETSSSVMVQESDQPGSIKEPSIHGFPQGIREQLASTEKLPELEKLIIDTYEIPEEYQTKTKYYYNEVDLNQDGNPEVFVVVIGPYTSGSGGSSAMIVYPVDGDLHVNQTFTLVHTPVIISDKMTNGAQEIIVMRSGGGGDSTYVTLTASHGEYDSVNNGQPLASLEEVHGTAILANDLVADMETGDYLTLGAEK